MVSSSQDLICKVYTSPPHKLKKLTEADSETVKLKYRRFIEDIVEPNNEKFKLWSKVKKKHKYFAKSNGQYFAKSNGQLKFNLYKSGSSSANFKLIPSVTESMSIAEVLYFG